jgi:hypothetical protein
MFEAERLEAKVLAQDLRNLIGIEKTGEPGLARQAFGQKNLHGRHAFIPFITARPGVVVIGNRHSVSPPFQLLR